jgi:motility quorum-sensing regulator/GCU-specific mRNA interferase toxin
MEKSTPHCKLIIVKRLLEQNKVMISNVAYEGAARLGLDKSDILKIVSELTPKQFYKSMTTYKDYKIWQDVYRTKFDEINIYLKITVIEQVAIVSFKEL